MARTRFPLLKRKDSTPTRQVTGTSYQASGAVAVPPVQYGEQGSSAKGIIPEEIPELTGVNSTRTYARMSRNDVSVRISLRAGKAPVFGGEYYFDPYDDDEENLVISEFCEFNLFHGMTISWLATLIQICRMMEAGFHPMQPVWELREWAPKKTSKGANRRKYTMLRKLASRPAETITKIDYDDNGGPVKLTQLAIGANGKATEVPIPIERLVIFVFDQDSGDLRGNPILRTAYRHWFYKDKLYSIDGIQKERHGIGVPDVELQPGYTNADQTAAINLARNLRTNEHAYIVRNTKMKVSFAKIEGQLVDALRSAEHHDDMIMKNIMLQFLNMGMGESGGGGRATGATAMDMFLKSMRFIANYICDQINYYVIPQMVAYNFETDKFPQLKVRNIGEAKDLQMWATAMANLVDKGIITVDDSTEQWFRQQVDMPKLQGTRKDAKPAEVKSIGTGGGGTGRTSGTIGKSESSGVV